MPDERCGNMVAVIHIAQFGDFAAFALAQHPGGIFGFFIVLFRIFVIISFRVTDIRQVITFAVVVKVYPIGRSGFSSA